MRCEATELACRPRFPGNIHRMELQSLTPEARRRVIRAVRKGAAVEDPTEARAAVAHARWVRALPPPERSRRSLRSRVLLALLGVSILIAVFWWKGGDIPPGSAAVVLVVGALPLAQRWWESMQNRRRRENAAAAERRNAAVAAARRD